MSKITEQELEKVLAEGLEFMCDEGDLGHQKYLIQTFEEAGVLTYDKGIVLKFGNQEFQITIVRSK